VEKKIFFPKNKKKEKKGKIFGVDVVLLGKGEEGGGGGGG